MAAFSVTQALVEHLKSMGYAASSRVPRKKPAEFVTVERVGGGTASKVDHPSMAIQTWADSDARAEEMGNAVKVALLVTPPPAGVHSIRVETGPYQFYDENTGKARYQLVLNVTCQLEI